MGQLQGIKYTKDASGYNRYVHIDLQQYGNDELLEDFLDLAEVQAHENDETISLDEFNKYIDERLKMDV